MEKSCPQCASSFSTDPERIAFLDSRGIPHPTLCPDCRQQRRLAFRNERSLYHRQCDLCKKQIISVYSPDKPLTVYCAACWYGDKWNPLAYGRDYDFNRPFFDQFKELLNEVPALANMVFNSVNCEYNSFCVNSKDCYMSARVGDSEKVLYSYLPLHSLSCADCAIITECQYCYECFDCRNCYNLLFSRHCKTTSDSAFCYDCIGCKNCIGCVGLRNCEYYVFNKKCTKDEYEKFKTENTLASRANIQKLNEKFNAELLKHPHRAAIIQNAENASGDYIVDSKNIHNCFDVEKSDTAYDSFGVEYSKDIHDGSFIYYGENCYENIANSQSSNILFSAVTIGGNFDLQYCFSCVNGANNSFGSVSLNKHGYCILNKQYSKEEYAALIPKIIAHMKKNRAHGARAEESGFAGSGAHDQEYGEFFPATISPFAYNESVANGYYPLTRESVMEKGWKWKESETKETEQMNYKIPDMIFDVSDSIINETLSCRNPQGGGECGKSYKLVAREIEQYRLFNVAVPDKCPDCRYVSRSAFHNPRKPHSRNCAKCSSPIQTTFAPSRKEKVYCESCYLKEVY